MKKRENEKKRKQEKQEKQEKRQKRQKAKKAKKAKKAFFCYFYCKGVYRMIHVKTDEIYGKNPIINANDLRSHIINIDSRFRKSQLEPPTDFQYEFAHMYKNVIHARIVSVEIPAVVYNFSRAKKNTMFRLDATDYTGVQHHLTITIPDGNYKTSQVVETIQQELNGIRDMYGMFFRITMDQRTNKVTIHHDGTAAPPCPGGPTHCPLEFGLTFVMVGLEDRRYDFGLGYNLGFTEKMYVVTTASITTESIISTAGDSYFLLAMDDMYTVEHKTEDTYIQCLAKMVRKKTVDGGEDGYMIQSNEFTFPRPTDVRQVRVRILDRYGVPIDIHHLNVSISLEISEVMNVQLYDNYRNYLWEEKEPRVVKHASGSSAPFVVPGRNFN